MRTTFSPTKALSSTKNQNPAHHCTDKRNRSWAQDSALGCCTRQPRVRFPSGTPPYRPSRMNYLAIRRSLYPVQDDTQQAKFNLGWILCWCMSRNENTKQTKRVRGMSSNLKNNFSFLKQTNNARASVRVRSLLKFYIYKNIKKTKTDLNGWTCWTCWHDEQWGNLILACKQSAGWMTCPVAHPSPPPSPLPAPPATILCLEGFGHPPIQAINSLAHTYI